MPSITLSESVSLANSVVTANTPNLDGLFWPMAVRNTFSIIFNTEKEHSALATLAGIMGNILRIYRCNRMLLTTGDVLNNFVGSRTNMLPQTIRLESNKNKKFKQTIVLMKTSTAEFSKNNVNLNSSKYINFPQNILLPKNNLIFI